MEREGEGEVSHGGGRDSAGKWQWWSITEEQGRVQAPGWRVPKAADMVALLLPIGHGLRGLEASTSQDTGLVHSGKEEWGPCGAPHLIWQGRSRAASCTPGYFTACPGLD